MTLEIPACEFCGDEADFTRQIQGAESPLPICDTCDHDKVTDCPGCGQWFLQANGVRLYDTASLYCPSCAMQHPVMAADLERAYRSDLTRGK